MQAYLDGVVEKVNEDKKRRLLKVGRPTSMTLVMLRLPLSL